MMKKCAICGHECKPSAFSCTECGEATWVPASQASDEVPTVRRPSAHPPAEPDAEDFPARKPARGGARGARSGSPT